VYFDPLEAYQRRLFSNGEKLALQQPAYAMKKQNPANGLGSIDETGGLVQHSVKRVKKKLNDFILNNYTTLFSNGPLSKE
jgi:hypothetical protein